MRMSRPAGSCPLAVAAALGLNLAAAWALAQGGGRTAPQNTLFDPRFEDLRKASVAWERRTGPDRRVVDLVCLVPDVPTFFEAVSAWDDRHYFPVLIDDVETTLKFLRAFRPARVVRLPSAAKPVAPEDLWDRALTAAGRAWAVDGLPPREEPRGDVVPRSLGPTPPGVVVSAPGSPSLAGAVALAAGRFQPLLRWEPGKGFYDNLTLDDAFRLAQSLEVLLAEHVRDYDRLGDDCDFVTLAGDYPFAFTGGIPKNPFGEGPNAFDDLILRARRDQRRWAFAGRLMGGPVESAYRAMCALFLRPGSALLVNTYGETTPPWTDYAMTAAAGRLDKVVKAAERPVPDLAAWHRAFDPLNRAGLVMVNTRGGATDFHPAGITADTPETVPAALVMVHSFSAAQPKNPDTIAGRWLSNGAFAVFGAMNEPGLVAFRPPALVAACLAENLPLVAAVRRLHFEPLGQPWRLVYLGDPLYRVAPVGKPSARLATWEGVAGWPAYGEFQQPGADAPEAVRLNWALKTAIFLTQTGATPRQRVDLPAALLGLARDRLDAKLQALYDTLLVDTLVSSGRSAELIDRLTRVPPAGRSADVRRHLETAQASALQRAYAARDFRQALALWSDVIRAEGSQGFVRAFTDRVAALADSPARRADWRDRLRAAGRSAPGEENPKVIADHLKRVEDQLRTAQGEGPTPAR